jgi:hypothetical protein
MSTGPSKTAAGIGPQPAVMRTARRPNLSHASQAQSIISRSDGWVMRLSECTAM